MTQISRPIQIALAALILFVAVWFLALRGHSSSSSGPESSAPSAISSSSSSPSSSASSAASPTLTKHAKNPSSTSSAHKAQHATPSAAGLSKTIDKAQQNVRRSQQDGHHAGAAKPTSKHAAGSTATPSPAAKHAPKAASAPSAKHAPKPAKQRAVAPTKPATAPAKAVKPATKSPPPASSGGASANTQAAVESQLAHGTPVAILFWNPQGSVDRAVRREVQSYGSHSRGKVAVHVALASEIGAFGSFASAVGVYSTPTILFVDPDGKTLSKSGLIDRYGIGQAFVEVALAK
jgi:hypothetical protein